MSLLYRVKKSPRGCVSVRKNLIVDQNAQAEFTIPKTTLNLECRSLVLASGRNCLSKVLEPLRCTTRWCEITRRSTSDQQPSPLIPGTAGLRGQSDWIFQLVYGAKNEGVINTVVRLTNSGPRTCKSWRKLSRTKIDLTRPLLNKSP